jgi:hypothetical protein
LTKCDHGSTSTLVVHAAAAADHPPAEVTVTSTQTSFESAVPWVKGWPIFTVRTTVSSR